MVVSILSAMKAVVIDKKKKKGSHHLSSITMLAWALIAGTVTKDYSTMYRFGKLALKIV